MSRIVIFFLSCFMCMAMLACENTPLIPANAVHPNLQCEFKGYLGICHNFMFTNGQFNCRKLICAFQHRMNGYRGISIGPAINGTSCGGNKMCLGGSCTELPSNMEILDQLNPNEPGILCYREMEKKPAYPG